MILKLEVDFGEGELLHIALHLDYPLLIDRPHVHRRSPIEKTA